MHIDTNQRAIMKLRSTLPYIFQRHVTATMSDVLILFVITLLGLPLAKICEVGLRMPRVVEPLGATGWTVADGFGYGLLRRYDDATYWLVLSLLFASIYILRLRSDRNRKSDPAWPEWAGGILFELVYLVYEWIEEGTFFDPDLGLQWFEGVILSISAFVIGANYARFCKMVWNFEVGRYDTAQFLEAATRIALFPVVAATVLSTLAGTLNAPREYPERQTLEAILLTLATLPYAIAWSVLQYRLR